jgi:hypothetical protein
MLASRRNDVATEFDVAEPLWPAFFSDEHRFRSGTHFIAGADGE